MAGETRVWRALAMALLRSALLGAALLLPSTDPCWPAGWVYAAGYAAWSALNVLLLARRSPALLRLRETERPRAREPWDRAFVVLFQFIFGVMLVVCATRAGPARARAAAAFGALGLALGLFTWALLSNQFAAGVVVLSPGQKVAESGPYARVRHPIYLAGAAAALCTPPALGSSAGLLPAAVLAALIVARTALEDRMLLRSLPGYADYAARVPYRLLPGIW